MLTPKNPVSSSSKYLITNKKSIPSKYLLFGAVVAALIAAFSAYIGFNKFTRSVPVVVMAVDKPAYTKIDHSDLKVVQVSRSAVQKGMFADQKPVIGKFTKTYVPAGTFLTGKMLADNNEAGDIAVDNSMVNPNTGTNPLAVALTDLKNKGLRAYAIPVDQIQGLGGNIVPGDKIDVTGAMKLPLGLGSSDQPVAKTIVRGRTVLGIIKNSDTISGIIMAVSPQEAQDLNFALLNGRLSVGLNPYETDLKASDTETTTAQMFIKKYIDTTISPNSAPAQEQLTAPASATPTN